MDRGVSLERLLLMKEAFEVSLLSQLQAKLLKQGFRDQYAVLLFRARASLTVANSPKKNSSRSFPRFSAQKPAGKLWLKYS